eukprot:CAMPEP_0170143394 /NCGR_PEP_ID=MMETSP0033_2-20121228/10729_1 /TAXON_ID=195969 /ORGANISM="Dolichomastix tenuilepis, Strain CCMP3274" /LENGTH=180 /DNA_ID=CAMNT_0010379841 /DNA_START=16 /DNA_END=558 /DNA_ORIENTATION=+
MSGCFSYICAPCSFVYNSLRTLSQIVMFFLNLAFILGGGLIVITTATDDSGERLSKEAQILDDLAYAAGGFAILIGVWGFIATFSTTPCRYCLAGACYSAVLGFFGSTLLMIGVPLMFVVGANTHTVTIVTLGAAFYYATIHICIFPPEASSSEGTADEEAPALSEDNKGYGAVETQEMS